MTDSWREIVLGEMMRLDAKYIKARNQGNLRKALEIAVVMDALKKGLKE